MASLVERYYNVPDAPHKQLIWLEGSHGLNDSNLGQFTDAMVNTVLAETNRYAPRGTQPHPDGEVVRSRPST
jgi:hypothetical protein